MALEGVVHKHPPQKNNAHLQFGHSFAQFNLLDLSGRGFLEEKSVSCVLSWRPADQSTLTGRSETTRAHSGVANPGSFFLAWDFKSTSNSRCLFSHLMALLG